MNVNLASTLVVDFPLALEKEHEHRKAKTMDSPNNSSSGKRIRLANPKRFSQIAWFLVVGLLLVPQMDARADIGPKPSMEFIFVQENDPALTIVEGTLLECPDAACTQATPLEELGPQGFRCTQDKCWSMAYGFSEYHRLAITFSDGKVRESNVFGNRFFDATYQVNVRTDDLVVEEDVWRSYSAYAGIFSFIIFGLCGTPLIVIAAISAVAWMSWRAGKAELAFPSARGPFILAWIVSVVSFVLGGLFSPTLPLTVLIEMALAAGYAKLRRRSMLTVLTLVTLANSITQPLLLLAFSFLDTAGKAEAWIYLILFEILIWLSEAVMLYAPQRKEIAFKEALGVSLGLNATSFLIGLALRV